MRPLKARTVLDAEVQKALDEIGGEWNTARAGGVFHGGILREDVTLTEEPIAIYHGLGRIPKYVAAVKSAGDTVAVAVEPHPDPRNYVFVKVGPRIPRVLAANFTPVGNVGSGEDDLHTYVMPAGTLERNGESVEIEYTVTTAANANSKRVRVYFGGAFLSDTGAAAASGISLVFRARVFRTGPAAERYSVVSLVTATWINTIASAAITQNLATDLTLRLTGEGVADNDVVCQASSVRFIPSATTPTALCNVLIA